MNKPITTVELLAQATKSVRTGEIDEAILILKSLLTQDPDHELATGMLASLYAEIAMLDRAEPLFEKVLALNGENSLARLHLGTTRMQLGKNELALSTLRPLLQDEKDYLAHFYTGALLAELNKIDEARIIYITTAQRMPSDHPLRQDLQAAIDALSEQEMT